MQISSGDLLTLAAIKAELTKRGVPIPEFVRPTDRFKQFQQTYRRAPAGFVMDCITFPRDEQPTPYQLEILEELPVQLRVAVRGPHGIGKTACAAWIILWAVLTAEDCKVPTTASAWRQLTKFLWPEVHKWAHRVDWDKVGRPPLNEPREMAMRSIRLGATVEAFAVASNNSAFIEGAHAERVCFIYDEAKLIPEETWDASEGAFAGAGADTAREAFALAISTPGPPAGRFYEIHTKQYGAGEWWTRHVTLEEGIAAGRISREWAENRKRDWGEDDPRYANRVLGEFATMQADGLIPLAHVEHAFELWRERKEAGDFGVVTAVGVDVGEGGDETTVAPYDDRSVLEIRTYAKGDPMETTARVLGLLHGLEGTDNLEMPISGALPIVDGIGIGSGVVARLRELGILVISFIASARTSRRDRTGEYGFVDKRSAGWWILAEALEERWLALPPDDTLEGELLAPTWKPVSGARVRVEPKELIKKRLRRSTNRADAVMQVVSGRVLEESDDLVTVAVAPAQKHDLRRLFQ